MLALVGMGLSQHKSTAGAAMCNEARVCKGITNSVEKGGNHEQMCLCLLVCCVFVYVRVYIPVNQVYINKNFKNMNT